jgi:Tol biopolymer transport system component
MRLSSSSLTRLSFLFAPLALSTVALGQSTERVSVTSDERQVFQHSSGADIDEHGNLVVFESAAKLTRDNNGVADVFRRNLITGVTRRVSLSSDEREGNLASGNPSVSRSGRFVAFRSQSNTLVPNDTNTGDDIFVRDIRTGTTEKVSISSSGLAKQCV